MSLHQDAIVIHEVYEEGAAARDGRLWAGDQILEVLTQYCSTGSTVTTLAQYLRDLKSGNKISADIC